MLFVICCLPLWDAWTLMQDFNYVYWSGNGWPVLVVAALILIIVIFLFSTEATFNHAGPDLRDTQTLVMVVSLFITMIGLLLVLVSMPITARTTEAHNMLLYQCSSSPDAQTLRAHYSSLLTLRKTSDCSQKYSIEECDGFEEIAPHTQYLRALETEFRCSGFCYEASNTAAVEANATALMTTMVKTLESGARPQSPVILAGGEQNAAAKQKKIRGPTLSANGEVAFPPTLFSNGNFKVTCEGAAGRQLITFAKDTAYQGWVIGVTLIAMSIVMGLWEWTSLTAK